MSSNETDSPYRAGPGLIPPHLAGRRKEQDVIKRALNLIKGKAGPMERSPHAPNALVGPRGVGKTVLLDWAISEAIARDIHTASITRSLLEGPESTLVSHILPEGWLKSKFDNVENVGTSVAGVGFNLGFKDDQSLLGSALSVFLSKQPLLLLLDEAHHCDHLRLNLLFEITQVCMTGKLPLAVVIAGTPGLEPHLQKCEATYVERYKFLPINTLKPVEAKEALEVPAKQDGLAMEHVALEMLLEWSDCYPFFLQLAGAEAWNATKQRGSNTITQQDARSGLETAEETRLSFYEKRHDEILNQGLLPHAKTIAGIFNDGSPKLRRGELAEELIKKNEGMDLDEALGVVDRLLDSGYLWRKVIMIEPGIPSMFSYVLNGPN